MKKFSLWCDFVERDFLAKDFQALVAVGAVNGATSNPSIFKNAITSSSAYEEQKKYYKNKEAKEVYEILATSDIKVAAYSLLENYVNGDDGFISLELDPALAHNKEASLEEAKRLAGIIAMPNLMIKIPATEESYDIMKELLAQGYNINATLIFSPKQTELCLAAFQKGNEEYKKRFPSCPLPQAVISIFVSRFDTLLAKDYKIEDNFQLGIKNANKCYNLIEKAKLSNVRALFASTGTKSEALAKDYYLRELKFPNAINTAPLDAIKVFLKKESAFKEAESDEALEEYFQALAKEGIRIEELYAKLLEDALKQFELAFRQLLNSL